MHCIMHYAKRERKLMVETVNMLVFLLIIAVFGILPSIWYLKRKTKNAGINKKPSLWFIIVTLLLFCLNLFLSSIIEEWSISFILGKVLFFPLIIIGILSISKESRNWNSRVKIFFFVSIVVLFSLIGNLLDYVKKHPQSSTQSQVIK